MVELQSALTGTLKPGRHGAERSGQGLTVREVGGRDLVQVGFWRDSGAAVREALAADLGFAMPVSLGTATSHAELTAFMVAPDKFWITAPLAAGLAGRLSERFATAVAVVAELGHSRTVIRLSGPSVREVLAQLVAVDLDPRVFPLGSVAMTPIHHVAVLVHFARGMDRVGAAIYDLYLPWTFAASLYEAVEHAGLAYGVIVEA